MESKEKEALEQFIDKSKQSKEPAKIVLKETTTDDDPFSYPTPENKLLTQTIEDRISNRNLREKYAKLIIRGLAVEILLAFLLVFLVGLGFLKLEEWIVVLLFESTLIQSFGAFIYVLKYLFKSQDN